jgi:hypothetical protein
MNSRAFAALTAAFLIAGLGTASHRLKAATAEPDRVASPEQRARATDALNLLENQDYDSFRDFHADGLDFAAVVEQDGRWFQVRIDPDRRTVTRRPS